MNDDRRTAGIDVSLPASALDTVPLGIAKSDRHGWLTYANREMLRIAGLEDWRGRSIRDVFRGESLETVRAGLRQRFEQRAGSAYPVDVTRADGTVVPVSITGFPDTDADDRVIGSLALVRDLTLERAQQSMVKLVEREADSQKLLAAIAAELQPIVAYDRLMVLRLNAERTHLRTIYLSDRAGLVQPQMFRWWRIPDSIKPLLDGQTLRIDDLNAWYAHPERKSMLADPEVKRFLAEGFLSTMSLPISHNGEQVACIVLARKATLGPFCDADDTTADTLPLTEAVSVALRNETESKLNFVLDLIGHISAAYESISAVAQTIVDQIARHYGWDDVSIYQVFEARGVIELIAARRIGDPLPVEQPYPIDSGVIGHVHREKRSVNIGDVHDSEWKGVRIVRDTASKSELCVPIGADARWLLNVEDGDFSAFAPEEQQDLERIAAVLAALLGRIRDFHYRAEVVKRANDAILLVDDRDAVFEANPAAAALLRIAENEIKGRSMADFFADPDEARTLLGGGAFPNHQVRMVRRGGEPVAVLLSVAKLPDETGRILVASDLTQVQRVERLELAQGLYREIVGQIKTPMSLAISWLRRDAHAREAPAGDSVPKTIAQLQKAELTLDRLMLVDRDTGAYPRHEVLLSVGGLLDSVIQEMPERESRLIDREGESGGAHVRADAYELRYCIQTVLSYLIRLAAEDDHVVLRVHESNDEIHLVACGRLPDLPQEIVDECRSSQARAEMGLGETTLTRIAARNHGRYLPPAHRLEGGVAQFGFAFPVASDDGGRR